MAVFSKFRTHYLEVLSPNYEKALLLSIDNIAAKFEDATPCSYRDMLRTKCETPARPLPQAIRHNNNPNAYRLWVKNVYHHTHNMISQILVRFTLSLTVSDIRILFFYFSIVFQLLKNLKFIHFGHLTNYKKIPMWSQFCFRFTLSHFFNFYFFLNFFQSS